MNIISKSDANASIRAAYSTAESIRIAENTPTYVHVEVVNDEVIQMFVLTPSPNTFFESIGHDDYYHKVYDSLDEVLAEIDKRDVISITGVREMNNMRFYDDPK